MSNERFEQFTDEFLWCVRRRAKGLVDAGSDARTDSVFSKVRTEFSALGASPDGLVLILLETPRRHYAWSVAAGEAALERGGLLAMIGSLEETSSPRPPVTWHLTFVPAAGSKTQWTFHHAEAQGPHGAPLAAGNAEWIEAALEMRSRKPDPFIRQDMFVSDIGYPERAILEARHDGLQQGAERGDPTRQYVKAIQYAFGTVVQRDAMRAFEWFHRVAERGHSSAQLILGVLYATGQGVPPDVHRAMGWFAAAAERGKDLAQYHLGKLYENGLAVPQDFRQAMQCHLAAAEAGNPLAEHRIGMLYREGRGVDEDLSAAWHWFRRSARHGYDPAFQELNLLDLDRRRDLTKEGWPGEMRERYEAFFRSRRSRADERADMLALLRVADACDKAIDEGWLSDEGVRVLVDGARSNKALQWGNTLELIVKTHRTGVDITRVLLELTNCNEAHARRVALLCLNCGAHPRPEDVNRMLVAGLADKSADVCSLAAELAATPFGQRDLLPAMRQAAKRHSHLCVWIDLLEQGYSLAKRATGDYSLRILGEDGRLLQPIRGWTVTDAELSAKGLDAVIAEKREESLTR